MSIANRLVRKSELADAAPPIQITFVNSLAAAPTPTPSLAAARGSSGLAARLVRNPMARDEYERGGFSDSDSDDDVDMGDEAPIRRPQQSGIRARLVRPSDRRSRSRSPQRQGVFACDAAIHFFKCFHLVRMCACVYAHVCLVRASVTVRN